MRQTKKACCEREREREQKREQKDREREREHKREAREAREARESRELIRHSRSSRNEVAPLAPALANGNTGSNYRRPTVHVPKVDIAPMTAQFNSMALYEDPVEKYHLRQVREDEAMHARLKHRLGANTGRDPYYLSKRI